MKRLGWAIGCATVMLLTACGNGEEKKPAGEKQQEHVQKQYVCPMKCTSPTASPGKCPKCGMTLEEVNPA